MAASNPDNAEELIEKIISELSESGIDSAIPLLAGLHPADIAHLLESIPPELRLQIWQHIDDENRGETLLELVEGVRDNIISETDVHALAAAVHLLDTDEIADLIPGLPDEVIAEVLFNVSLEDRNLLTQLRSYPEDTAGGLMDIDAVTIRPRITVAVVRRYLRMLAELPEYTDKLFVVNHDNQLTGTVLLSDLVTADDEQRISEITNTEPRYFTVEQDELEVATSFARYNLISAPVVTEDQRLIGRITVDDVVDVIQDEADYRMMASAGLDEEQDIFAPVAQTTRSRAVWLGINLITALLASVVIGRFQDTIGQLVALAVLMPIVASMGGNTGIQSLTVVIRGLSVGTISASNARRIFLKEMLVGSLNGLIWALAVAVITVLWFDNLQLGIIIGAAMVITMASSALFGAFLPVAMTRMGIDPALAGGVALTTVADIVGFVSFLGLAALFLT
jgi:magnesium transporter